MTDKELKRLNRRELLEMLLHQTKRADELQARVQTLEAEIKNRQYILAESGNLAEAALRLNGFFDAAQKAADDYLAQAKTVLVKAQESAEESRKKAEREATEIRERAEKERADLLALSVHDMERILQSLHPDKTPIKPVERENQKSEVLNHELEDIDLLIDDSQNRKRGHWKSKLKSPLPDSDTAPQTEERREAQDESK